MINKQNLWFLTLFSLIIVLSIYYLTMPKDILDQSNMINRDLDGNVVLKETDALSVLKIAREEEVLNEMEALQDILLNENTSTEEKNNAYDNLKSINRNKGEEEKLEELINKEYSTKSFVKIDEDQIKIVIESDKHDETLANNIMRFVQKNYQTKMFITVKFQS